MLSLSLSAKYNSGRNCKPLKQLFLMVAMLFFTHLADAQRVLSGADYPCDNSHDLETPQVPPLVDLCSENQVSIDLAIEIGEGSNYPNATEILQAFGVPGTRQVLNKEFHVIGELYIDDNISFEECKFVIDSDQRIVVVDDKTLGAYKSDFYTCDKMWQGIEVVNTSRIHFRSCRIEDAIIAISIESNNRSIILEDNKFSRNEVCIYGKNSGTLGGIGNGRSHAFAIKSFQGNIFDCQSLLPLKTANTYKYGMAGIIFEDDNVPFLPGDRMNIFKGYIRVGIISKNSFVNISNCSFKDINYTDKVPVTKTNTASSIYSNTDAANGLGIYAEKSDLYVSSQQLINNEKAYFLNCRRGAINTNATNLYINDCDFVASFDFAYKTLISSINNTKKEKIEITDNRFSISNTSVSLGAIYLDRSMNINSIRNNNFTFPTPSSNKNYTVKCITVNNTGATTETASTFINNNNILNNNYSLSLTGISVSNGNGYQIVSNTVKKIGINNSIGIKLFNVTYGSVTNNFVYGFNDSNSFDDNTVFCYQIQNTLINPTAPSSAPESPAAVNLRLYICSNYAEAGYKNFDFRGNNKYVVFADNSMYKGSGANLYLDQFSAAVLPNISMQWNGTTEYRRNTWLGNGSGLTNGGSGAFLTTGSPLLSQFAVLPSFKIPFQTNGLSNSYYAFGNITVPPPFTKDDWFKEIADLLNDVGCQSFSGGVPPGERWEALDEEILLGKYGNQYPATLWEANRLLYAKLLANPILLQGHPDRQTFFDGIETTNIPFFNEIEKRRQLLYANSTELDELSELRLQKEDVYEHLKIHIQTNNELYGENDWSEDAMQDLFILEAQLEQIETAIAQLSSTIDADRVTKATQLMQYNDNLPNNNVAHELAAKRMTHLWLKAIVQNGVLNETDIDEVRTIASNCYRNVGASKYTGIEMIPFCDRDPFYKTNCPNGAIGKIKKEEVAFGISPNPANTNLTFKASSTISNFSVIDITGRLIPVSYNDNGDNNYFFDVTPLTNGIYVLNVQYNDGKQSTHKINIIH